MSAIEEYVASFTTDPGYLNWASFGPLSPVVRAEVFADADLLASGRPSSLPLISERIDEATALIGSVLRLDEAGVTLQPASSYGIMHALYGLSGGVITASTEFPSLTIALDRAAKASDGRLKPRWIDPAEGRVTADAVAEAIDDDVTALVVSHVDFRTGYRADLAALREALGPDRLLILDAVQSFGVVDEDYAAADVIVGHAYKWLRAGRGTAFAWFSDRARDRIAPVLSGFRGVAGGLPVDDLPSPHAGVRAFTIAEPDQLAAARLATSLQEIISVGVGEVESALAAKVDAVLEIADRHGVPVRSPREPERRAGIVALAPNEPGRLAAALVNAGVTATTRGETVRIAPHAGTSDEGLRLLDDAIAASGNETFTVA